MIDKLELLVPDDVPRRDENWRKHRVVPAKAGSLYSTTLNEDSNLALRVHYNLRVPVAKEKRHFKIDFTDTRLLTAEDLKWRLNWLFRIRPDQASSLRISRIDFAADVCGVSVEWFKRHSRVKRKQSLRSYEVCEVETSKGAVTSVVFGKRPDLYRIYNRVAEKRARGADVLYYGMFSGAPAPTATRVERQCSGRAIPKNVATLGGLFEHAADVNPFPNLICTQTDDGEISTDNWTPQMWLMSVGLASAVRELGEATVRARLNRTGNANRFFEKYSDLLHIDSPGVTEDRLREIYRKGTIKQLNLPRTGADGKVRYPAGGFMLTL